MIKIHEKGKLIYITFLNNYQKKKTLDFKKKSTIGYSRWILKLKKKHDNGHVLS